MPIYFAASEQGRHLARAVPPQPPPTAVQAQCTPRRGNGRAPKPVKPQHGAWPGYTQPVAQAPQTAAPPQPGTRAQGPAAKEARYGYINRTWLLVLGHRLAAALRRCEEAVRARRDRQRVERPNVPVGHCGIQLEFT